MDGLFKLVSILYVKKKTHFYGFFFFLVAFELACIQCTSPLRRVPQMRDHSCLDGTLAPVPCAQSIHASKNYKNCISVLYNGGKKNTNL